MKVSSLVSYSRQVVQLAERYRACQRTRINLDMTGDLAAVRGLVSVIKVVKAADAVALLYAATRSDSRRAER